jgi:hypothetical protein
LTNPNLPWFLMRAVGSSLSVPAEPFAKRHASFTENQIQTFPHGPKIADSDPFLPAPPPKDPFLQITGNRLRSARKEEIC